MLFHRRTWLAACIGALACLPAFASAPTAPRDLWAPSHVLKPSLHVTTLEGTPFDLAAQHGRWVLVFFWASWCAPCTASMPAISQFVGMHSNVSGIGLAVMETRRSAVERFASAHRLHFQLAQIDLAELQRLSGSVPGAPEFATPTTAIPVTWLIAPDGTLARVWNSKYDVHQLERIMQAAGYPDAPQP